MKKKILAGLCAGALFCGMVSAPVSAWETKYSKGDINMDGKIDGHDVMDSLKEYTYYYLCRLDHYLTEEQIELADITPKKSFEIYKDSLTGEMVERESPIAPHDTRMLLVYYAYGIVDETVRETDIVDWAKEYYPHLFEE